MAAATPTIECSRCDAQIPQQQQQNLDGSELCKESVEKIKIAERIRFFSGCVLLAQQSPSLARFLDFQEPGQVAVLTEEECGMLKTYLRKNNPEKHECQVCDGTTWWCDDCTQSDDIIHLSYRLADYKKLCFSLEYLKHRGLISAAQSARLVKATKTKTSRR